MSLLFHRRFCIVVGVISTIIEVLPILRQPVITVCLLQQLTIHPTAVTLVIAATDKNSDNNSDNKNIACTLRNSVLYAADLLHSEIETSWRTLNGTRKITSSARGQR